MVRFLPKARPKPKAKPTVRPKAKAKGKAAPKAKAGPLPGRSLPGSTGGVAPVSGLTGQGKVLKDGGETYDVDLNLQNAASNTNKFYRMQVVECNDKSKYWFVQHWGRIGTSGQSKVSPFSGKEAAVKALKSKFRQKAGVAFESRGSAAPGSSSVTGKYELTARLQAAGAKRATKKGAVAISLMWDHSSRQKRNDLDLHVTAPSGETIFFAHKKSKCGGMLDVDRRQDAPKPVENIVWTTKAPKGNYKVSVVNFSANHRAATSFEVGIVKDGGEMEMLKKTVPGNDGAKVLVKKFTY